MNIEMGKDDQYQTRDGRPVRIHAVDIEGEWPVLYSVRRGDKWTMRLALRDGFNLDPETQLADDIIPKPVVIELRSWGDK